jgi:ferredoxin
LHLLFEGDKECKASCLGQGSCIKVCLAGAISYDGEGLVWVDKDLCVSCGKCIEVCPTEVMRYIPRTADYIVACNSTDKAAEVQKYCSVGCTGCRACEKRSPEGGFGVVNNLARINYRRRGERYYAHLACPTKCIIANLRDTGEPPPAAPDSGKNVQA